MINSSTFSIFNNYYFITLEEYIIHRPYDDWIPLHTTDLFWTIWNSTETESRDRRFLVIDSIFVHHPQATIIVLSPSLDDQYLFSTYRQLGYQIFSTSLSVDQMIRWRWYVSPESKKFLEMLNSSSPTDYDLYQKAYIKAMLLYLYGGNYIDLDMVLLQPLPKHPFVGLDRSVTGDDCSWCIKNRSGLYLSTRLMQFHFYRKFLRKILENAFGFHINNDSCIECVESQAYAEHIIVNRSMNTTDLNDLKIIEPQRFYPFVAKDMKLIFHDKNRDKSLLLADLMKRSYAFRFFGHITDSFKVASDSVMDYLLNQFNLGVIQPKSMVNEETNKFSGLINSPIYIYTKKKQGRFYGHDAIYLKADAASASGHMQWNVNISAVNGTVTYSTTNLFSRLTLADVNVMLNTLSYQPNELSSVDTLNIYLTNGIIHVNSSLNIIVFSKWVNFLLKTVDMPNQISVIDNVIANVHTYFPKTSIYIASNIDHSVLNQNKPVDASSSDSVKVTNYQEDVFIYHVPKAENDVTMDDYIKKSTQTPFFFLLNEKFTIEEYTHLDVLLELIHMYESVSIITEDVPENRKAINDYSSLFLKYNQENKVQNKEPEQEPKPEHDDEKDNPSDESFTNDSFEETNPCEKVNSLPNVFMARTESMNLADFEEFFKIDDYDAFYEKLSRKNRTVYACRYI